MVGSYNMKKMIMLGMTLLGLGGFSAAASTIDGFALVIDGVPNSGTDEITYLNWAINAWNSGQLGGTSIGTEVYYPIGSAPIPLPNVPTDVNYVKNASPSDNVVTLDGSVPYIVAHWGGSGGGADIMYYVQGISGEVDLSTAGNFPPDFSLGGISSVTTVGGAGATVPDAASSIGLFSLGLCGLCSFARTQKR